MKELLTTIAIVLVVFISGCKKDDFEEIQTQCPVVISTDPANNATGVLLDKIIAATFNKKMDPATINIVSYTPHEGETPITGTVSYVDSTASFRPSNVLKPFTTYTGRVKTTVKDLFRSSLQEDYVWSFKTIPQLTLVSNPLDGGTANGAGTYAQSSMVTVNGTAYKGFSFVNWTENGTVVSLDSVYRFPMDGNKTLTANFTTQFVITLLASPVAGGSTSGWGLYNDGSTVNAVATPNPGYTFSNWTENGTVVSSSSSYQFPVSGNRTLVAHFIVIPTTQYSVSLSSNPTAGGSTIGSGTYNSGASVSVTANPNSGYTFTNWTEGATVVSSSSNYTFTISANRTLVAHYTLIPPTPYSVFLSSNPAVGGATTGGGVHNSGTSVTVTATASPGFTFTNWKEGTTIVSSSANYTFTISANRTLVANFTAVSPTQYSVNLSSNPVAGGTTTGGGAFDSGTTLLVSANPNNGYTFTNWTEGATIVSTSANYTFTISANRTLVANFAVIPPAQYSVNLSSNPVLGGTTTGGGLHDSGTSVTITATPNVGYTFTNWTEGATIVSASSNYTFIISGGRTLVANFALIPPNQYSLNLSSNPTLGGTTFGGGLHNSGTSVTISATPNVGYTFTNWTEGATIISTSANYTLTISANRTLVANFTLIPPTQYSVNLSSNPTLGGTTSGGGLHNSGSSVTVSAVPNSGYTFSNWTEGATIVSSSANYTFIISGGRTLVANFTLVPTQYSVNLSSNPALGGSTSGGGSFNSGASVTATAVPNSGYAFSNWTEGVNVISSNANYTFTISANRTLVANFTVVSPTQYSVNLSSNPALGGSTSGGGSFNSGASVTVSAVPNSGYTFVSWTEGVNIVSLTEDLTFTINSNRTLVANFALEVGPAPTVISNIPAVDAVDVERNITVTATFDMDMDPLTINDLTFTLFEGTTQIDGLVSYSNTPTPTASFNPTTDLVSGTTYTVTVTIGAENMEGTPLENDYSWTFTTVRPAGPDGIDLDCAAPFAILAGSTITSTGPSIINGDIGLSPGSALIGFPPGTINGTIHIDAIAAAAQLCLTTSYNDGQGRSLDAISLPGQLGGLTLAPGLYVNSSTSGISGTGANGILTLDAGGDENAVWIFKMGSTLTTDPATSIVLAGGAQAKNIFWIVGTSATLGTTSVFYGNILADQSITLNTGAVLNGRALTRIAAVTIDASTINKP